jgi:hypothetical protein
MTSVRDWCPHCRETGWACTCGKPAATSPMTTPQNLEGVIELGGRLRQTSYRGYTIRGQECCADLMLRAADMIERLSSDTRND